MGQEDRVTLKLSRASRSEIYAALWPVLWSGGAGEATANLFAGSAVYATQQRAASWRTLHCAVARLKCWFSFIINQINMARRYHWQPQYGSSTVRPGCSAVRRPTASAASAAGPQIGNRCPCRACSSHCRSRPMAMWSSPLPPLSLSSLQTLQVYRIAVCRASRGVCEIFGQWIFMWAAVCRARSFRWLCNAVPANRTGTLIMLHKSQRLNTWQRLSALWLLWSISILYWDYIDTHPLAACKPIHCDFKHFRRLLVLTVRRTVYLVSLASAAWNCNNICPKKYLHFTQSCSLGKSYSQPFELLRECEGRWGRCNHSFRHFTKLYRRLSFPLLICLTTVWVLLLFRLAWNKKTFFI